MKKIVLTILILTLILSVSCNSTKENDFKNNTDNVVSIEENYKINEENIKNGKLIELNSNSLSESKIIESIDINDMGIDKKEDDILKLMEYGYNAEDEIIYLIISFSNSKYENYKFLLLEYNFNNSKLRVLRDTSNEIILVESMENLNYINNKLYWIEGVKGEENTYSVLKSYNLLNDELLILDNLNIKEHSSILDYYISNENLLYLVDEHNANTLYVYNLKTNKIYDNFKIGDIEDGYKTRIVDNKYISHKIEANNNVYIKRLSIDDNEEKILSIPSNYKIIDYRVNNNYFIIETDIEMIIYKVDSGEILKMENNKYEIELIEDDLILYEDNKFFIIDLIKDEVKSNNVAKLFDFKIIENRILYSIGDGDKYSIYELN